MADSSRATLPTDLGGALSPVGRAIVSWRALAIAAAFAAAIVVLFRATPALDLATARAFYLGDNRFVGHNAFGDALRQVFLITPYVALAALVGLWAARRFRPASRAKLWAPSGRGVIFLVASLAIGPGLLVNVVAKDHSHRPRPIQVEDFGGTMPFRPVGDFDGACARNCSFVSGEGALGFWTLAPALLAPPALQAPLLAAAVLFGLATGVLRMAFGGHFLSDTVLAALTSWVVIIAVWQMVFGRPRPTRTA